MCKNTELRGKRKEERGKKKEVPIIVPMDIGMRLGTPQKRNPPQRRKEWLIINF